MLTEKGKKTCLDLTRIVAQNAISISIMTNGTSLFEKAYTLANEFKPIMDEKLGNVNGILYPVVQLNLLGVGIFTTCTLTIIAAYGTGLAFDKAYEHYIHKKNGLL
ncbi:MAG: hypothetical protein WC755_04205 [Candidatus Woesearchaeota archaeon]|jgi:hypothetical protein